MIPLKSYKLDYHSQVAILIPCYNEALTIEKVIHDFKIELPEAKIYVYDNNSTDDTVSRARVAGAVVRSENIQGKGAVIRRMFRDVIADYYVMVDGDDTYDSSVVLEMLRIANEGPYDLVNCVRIAVGKDAYRVGHRIGNTLLTGVVSYIFGDQIKDMLSGYKVLSNRYVKSFPAFSSGFDIETEITVHALELSMPVAQVKGSYRVRPEGSESKLSTYKDGFRILFQIINLFKYERPMQFFSIISIILLCISLGMGIPVVIHFFQTGLVPRLPTALLSVGIMLLAFLSFINGLILDTITRGRKEAKLLLMVWIT